MGAEAALSAGTERWEQVGWPGQRPRPGGEAPVLGGAELPLEHATEEASLNNQETSTEAPRHR